MPGSQTLLSIIDSQVLPLCVTLLPFIYGFVESGCTHSPISSPCPGSTFAQRLGETSGFHEAWDVWAVRQRYGSSEKLHKSPTEYPTPSAHSFIYRAILESASSGSACIVSGEAENMAVRTSCGESTSRSSHQKVPSQCRMNPSVTPGKSDTSKGISFGFSLVSGCSP